MVEHAQCTPTLYDTIRLARIVNEVTRQLKIRVQQRRRLPDQNDRILSVINKCTKPQRSHRGREVGLPYSGGGDWELAFRRDIDKLNITTSAGQLSKVAADDKLFLAAARIDPEKSAGIACRFAQLQRCRIVLDRLRDYKRWCKEQELEPGYPQNEINQEKSLANAEHLLLRYMHVLLHSLRNLVILHVAFELLLRIQRIFNQGWFFEWPNRRRPLSSTWPWNIKPSLVVLWGVCWMFYDAINFEGEEQTPMQNSTLDNDLVFWDVEAASTAPQTQPIEGYLRLDPQDARSFNVLTDTAPQSSVEAMPGSRQEAPLPLGDLTLPMYSNGSIYMPTGPNASLPPFRGHQRFPFPQNPGDPATFQGHPQNWQHTLGPSSPHVTRPYSHNPPRIIVQPAQILSPELNRRPQEHSSSPRSVASGYSNDMPLRSTNSYSVSPESGTPSPGRALPDSINSPTMTASSPSSSLKKERIIKKNEKGHYCEWSKHMDKHDRPYSCSESGCEKLQGFTYPGGLIRHEREVHKKHGGPKEALYCPHSSCKRSSGPGFTRRENYNEHLRRVHGETAERRDEPLEGDDNSDAHVEVGRKRKRKSSSAASARSDSAPITDDTESLRDEVKRLRRENEEMRNSFQRLEEAIRLGRHGC
ncbi:hypothetical protein GP486_003201 [Trichoglossum hirsutum]|uniref:C2H2-type domain-containing protein n=1 Tax=Trichoglossum hirsutum TaxID=265104 RepID=A0A9P8LDJ3_9PEZI|nr:hypothetical protein GP486_003201 [Trichoglossum hirsutum]